MSNQLSVAAITAFGIDVKHAYQDKGKLRDTVMVKTGVVGSTKRFNKMGSGVATRRGSPSSDITPMNIGHSNQTATLEAWNAAEFTDVFDDAATNIDEKSELAGVIAKAMSRREDQMIIDAADAASTTLTIASSVGGSSSGLNVAKLRRGGKLLGEQGVDDEDGKTWVGSYAGREGLLGETEATSTDYNTVKALVQGDINSFCGFDFKWIATRAGEGGLPLSGSDRTNFAYARSALGLAISVDMKTHIDWIPMKISWLCNMVFKAGAVDIDALGIVEATCVES